MREKNDIRLFFALWPDESIRNQIDCYLNNLPDESGRRVPRYNWHMTLHFIGNTTFREKGCLDKQARKVCMSPFELTLDQTGFFKRPKVFWLGCYHVPKALIDLQINLGREISHCEYQPETRPYSPHITVARKVVERPELKLDQGISWQLDHFVLIESIAEMGSVRYQVIEKYPLR